MPIAHSGRDSTALAQLQPHYSHTSMRTVAHATGMRAAAAAVGVRGRISAGGGGTACTSDRRAALAGHGLYFRDIGYSALPTMQIAESRKKRAVYFSNHQGLLHSRWQTKHDRSAAGALHKQMVSWTSMRA